MSTLKDKVKAMPHITFQRTIMKNVVPTPEYQKYYAHGPNALTREEKEVLVKNIIANVGAEGLKPTITTDDLTSFVVATTIRLATHK